MKVLLVAINAKYIHSNLAVYSLMSYANQYKDQISIKELTINHTQEDILKEIYKEKADIVAFSCYIWNISIVRSVSSELKKVQPGVKIWFGGPEVSYDARACLAKNEQLEGIMIGEGEETFLELIKYYLERQMMLSDIDGIAYREESRVIITKDRKPIRLDCVPFPYEEMECFRNRIIYYESSRGCPYSCSYCLSSNERRVRFRSLELVKRELQYFLDYQIPQVKFIDRTFNCNKEHAMAIWKYLKEHDNQITNFHFEISADILDDEEIDFLATLRPGQVQFEIGVQTTNPQTVQAIRRKTEFDKLAHNVTRINEAGNIHQHLDLIAGLPLEDYHSFEKSFQDVYRLRPDQLQLGFLKVLKGSPMELDCKEHGICYRSTPPYEVLYTGRLPYEDLLRIKGVCSMIEVYYNSGQFTYAIRFLEQYYTTSPMQLYQAISDYYENTGNSMLSHNRMRRYELLLEFFCTVVVKDLECEEKQELVSVFEEILVLDLFLRENIKSRPAFSPAYHNRTDLRELYNKYGAKNRMIHIETFRYDVINTALTGKRVEKETTILFDYGSRDPLSKAAGIMIL